MPGLALDYATRRCVWAESVREDSAPSPSDRCSRARIVRTYANDSALLRRRCGRSTTTGSKSFGASPSYSTREGDVSTSTLLLQPVRTPTCRILKPGRLRLVRLGKDRVCLA